jgi:YgiT-type zinc finger domain-containing protein
MKKKPMSYDYGECHVCGEPMEERRVNQEFWIKDKLVVIEDVPAGVCLQCGEKVVKADVGQGIATLLEDSKRLRKARMISVPVLRFAEETELSVKLPKFKPV